MIVVCSFCDISCLVTVADCRDRRNGAVIVACSFVIYHV